MDSFHDGSMVTRFDLVLFGDPVDHSLSPVIQQAGLDAAGLAGTYRAVRVDEEGYRRGCADLRAGLWSGANVTMPHKRLAVEEMDALSSGAERAVSVNTVVVEGSRLTGHSTDIDGIQQVWQEAALPRGVPVLVLGAGGAAAAALIAIDTDEVFVSSRHFEDAARLAAAIDVGVRPVPWGTAVAGAVVVNATPLGMAGDSLPLDIVEESAGLLDMAYARRATPAVLAADRAGVPYATGTDLLLAQATASFTLWTGRVAPTAQMRAALQKAQATA
jgi:shikimate dehydrogenase